ncbi:MAG: alcohol dehydrogenase catalytic domain-containing protein [Chloroflexi bacterium]|nr:alcohol dehydrogenase catalytic domain-containing protein [Chloroflexota bacterium]
MQALHLNNGQLSFRDDYPEPTLSGGEAIVRVRLAGICSTDLELVKGYGGGFNGVLGHEFVGEVVQAADSQWIGQRVVGSINMGCGKCKMCLQHGVEHCFRRQVIGIKGRDGVFAEYVSVPLDNLLIVPDEVSDEAAVFTEPLAAAVRIREQVVVSPSARTAVIGPGRLGMLVGLVMALAGTNVAILGRRTASLKLPADMGLKTGIASERPDNSFDFIVEVTGNNAGLAEAIRLIRPLGTIILKSTFQGESHLDLAKLVVDEITVTGSRCGPFAPALRLLERKQVNVEALIDAQYALADGLEAFAHASESGVRKVLLKPA